MGTAEPNKKELTQTGHYGLSRPTNGAEMRGTLARRTRVIVQRLRGVDVHGVVNEHVIRACARGIPSPGTNEIREEKSLY